MKDKGSSVCPTCDTWFEKRAYTQIYCTHDCREIDYSKKVGYGTARTQRFRAQKYGLTEHFSYDEWLALCGSYDNKCLRCKKKKKLVPDHVVPLDKGGDNTISNIQPLCSGCNSKKKAKVIDYRPTTTGNKRMVGQHVAFTVLVEKGISEHEATPILNAIKMIRGVCEVQPHKIT